MLERAVLLQRTGSLSGRDLVLGGPKQKAAAPESASSDTEQKSLDTLEREHLVRALTECRWNVSKAAKLLGISRDTLRYRMERHGLQR